MTSEDGRNVKLFGKSVNLEDEWHRIAGNLGSLCEGHRYIEYEREIARLKLKLVHLQEEADGCRAHNKNLSTLNDDLIERVKNLISMQDGQLEQYSTALVLLTEERRDLWHTLGATQRRLKELEERLASCGCRGKPEQGGGDETQSVVSSQDFDSDSENTVDVASRIRRQQLEESNKKENGEEINVECLANELAEAEECGDRHIDSYESSIETKSCDAVRCAVTPAKPKGLFVNSMIAKIEKKHKLVEDRIVNGDAPSEEVEKKFKLKSFEERRALKDEEKEMFGERRIFRAEEKELSSEEGESTEEVNLMRSRVVELEQEVAELRETCEMLSQMLERTYDELLPSDSRDDAKDQLIACLRSRLFEAICDLMKVEKSRADVKSVACGSSLPRAPKAPDLPPPTPAPVVTRSDPVISAAKTPSSPASKLKALRDDHYSKLKKFACWNPKRPEDSA